MSAHKRSILVTGATGNQGGGVVRQCLQSGHNVSAYVRDASSAAAQELQKLGVELVMGTYDDIEALRSATLNVDAVFHTAPQTGDFPDDQRRSINVITAAGVSPKVTSFILSSPLKTGQHESFPGWGPEYPMYTYWLSKHGIEEAVRKNTGFQNWTIVRPGFFLQNFKPPVRDITLPGFVQDRILRVGWKPDTKIAWIDAADVGVVAAAALSDPKAYAGREIDLAVAALTVDQLAAKIEHALEAKVKVHFYSDEELQDLASKGSPVPGAHRWSNEVPGESAAEAAKEFHLTSVDSFLSKNISQIMSP